MDFLRVTLALITVFGLLGLLYFLSHRAKAGAGVQLRVRPLWPKGLRRLSRSDGGSLNVLRRVTLTSTHQLHLVSSNGQTFLVCTHPAGCSPLRAGDALFLAGEDGAAPEDVKRYAS